MSSTSGASEDSMSFTRHHLKNLPPSPQTIINQLSPEEKSLLVLLATNERKKNDAASTFLKVLLVVYDGMPRIIYYNFFLVFEFDVFLK